MTRRSLLFLLGASVILLLLQSSSAESNDCSKSSRLHRKTFRSPAFSLRPGDVQDRFYTMEFPEGHLGIKNFIGEVVDELGIPVPLSEVYLHHWVVVQLYVSESEAEDFHFGGSHSNSSARVAGNDGICQHQSLSQYWGLGSETRHTNYAVPAPYAINVGDPRKIPDGYKEVWQLNVHAIDVRDTEDPQGCLECRCDLYNVTTDQAGTPLAKGYKGGLRCCYEGTRCRVKEGGEGGKKKTLYLQYTIEWVEWDDCVRPVKAYIFDVTDDGQRDPLNSKVGCKVEYDVPACDQSSSGGDCLHTLKNSVVIPRGGNLVYGVAHQHGGAQGMIMEGEDGRLVCSSIPSYGNGEAPGDEAGFVVGMSTCYPKAGSVRLRNEERIQLTSHYRSSVEGHTGVMALFYVLVSEEDGVESDEGYKGVPKTGGLMILAAVLIVVLAAAFGVYIGARLNSHDYYEPV